MAPQADLAPLEELFRARVITFLVEKGLLPLERAKMLRGWVHSGFHVHRSRRVEPTERADLERLAQYIIRNPFSVEIRKERAVRRTLVYLDGKQLPDTRIPPPAGKGRHRVTVTVPVAASQTD